MPKTKKLQQNVMLVTRLKKPEHRRLVKQLKDLGYGVADGRVDLDNVTASDVYLERLPSQRD